MKINKDVIAKMRPCNERFENYLSHYSDFNGNLEEFLALDEITFSDKVWVFVRLANKSQNISFAIKCAKEVLGVFESKYPKDLRPRKAVEATKVYFSNPSESNRAAADAAAYAAYAAARAANVAADAAANAADAASRAAYAAYAADAAANAADAASRAAYAVTHAVAYAAYAAADAAANAAYAAADAAARTKMESKILQLMLEVL